MDYHRKSSCESPWGPLQSAYPLAELPADRDAQLLAVDPRATVASIVYVGMSSSCVIESEPSITSENNACLRFQGGRLFHAVSFKPGVQGMRGHGRCISCRNSLWSSSEKNS